MLTKKNPHKKSSRLKISWTKKVVNEKYLGQKKQAIKKTLH